MPGSCEVCSSEPSKYRCPTCELMRYMIAVPILDHSLTFLVALAARLHAPSLIRYTVL
jgi:hypothetical protein